MEKWGNKQRKKKHVVIGAICDIPERLTRISQFLRSINVRETAHRGNYLVRKYIILDSCDGGNIFP